MKLGIIERLIVNSPLRGLSLRMLEPTLFNSMVPFPRGAHILDLGCGNGMGLVSLAKRYAPASLTGMDIDPQQLTRARKRLTRQGINAQVIEADAASIPLPASTYDIITCTGCLHHVEDWPRALAETARLLRHGGLVYMLEFYRPLLKAFHIIAPHPENRFTHAGLLHALPQHGLTILAHRNVFGLFGFIVARKTATPQYD